MQTVCPAGDMIFDPDYRWSLRVQSLRQPWWISLIHTQHNLEGTLAKRWWAVEAASVEAWSPVRLLAIDAMLRLCRQCGICTLCEPLRFILWASSAVWPNCVTNLLLNIR